MIKAKDWSGKDLKGTWFVTLKIDGVRAISDGKVVTSRNGKPLYGQLAVHASCFRDAEIFCGTFKDTIQTVRTQEGTHVQRKHIYSLDPVDERLVVGEVDNPTADLIKKGMKEAVKAGYEGLVFRQGETWLKVKPVVTHDVVVLDCYEGEGKHAGKLGGFCTPMGRVGTGLTDEQREEFWKAYKTSAGHSPVGLIIEVESMQLTPDGKFRFPRFKHFRFDKDK